LILFQIAGNFFEIDFQLLMPIGRNRFLTGGEFEPRRTCLHAAAVWRSLSPMAQVQLARWLLSYQFRSIKTAVYAINQRAYPAN
jgi:hypothetical protein